MDEKKEWRYCVVGNIIKTRIDENGILRHGTAAFTGGTKVYLCGKYWNEACGKISVIGLNRYKSYQVVDTDPNMIENIRLQKTFKPSILNLMDNWEFSDCWWNNTKNDKAEAEAFIENWNSRNS